MGGCESCFGGLSSTAGGQNAPTKAGRGKARPQDSLTRLSSAHANLIPNNNGLKPEDKYEFPPIKKDHSEVLGEGAFGEVRQVTSRQTKQVVACKTMVKAKLSADAAAAFMKEVDFQLSLDHPNIVRLYETFEDKRSVYLILELCTGGEMFDQIQEQGHFNEFCAAHCMYQIMKAVVYMHKYACIAHRDLKPENFLLKHKQVKINDNVVKVIDFGIAARFTKVSDNADAEGKSTLKSKVGTAYYVAPEIISGNGYNELVDVWSAGVILYILLSGCPPFSGETDQQILQEVKAGKISFELEEFDEVSEEAKELIREMCRVNVGRSPGKRRPTAAQVLENKWLQQAENKAPLKESMNKPYMHDFVGKLRKFRSVNRFKKAALNIIVHRLDDAKINGLREAFERIDKNGDGCITLVEMKEACGLAGLTGDEECKKLFESIDVDESGSIGYSEFLAAMVNQKDAIAESVAREAFRIFDRDGNGQISLVELKEMLEHPDHAQHAGCNAMDAAEIEQIFREADVDGDGEIDFHEFQTMLTK